jgi:hypothetical protein
VSFTPIFFLKENCCLREIETWFPIRLPFVTLGMEKSIYDTVQAWQGINPNTVPADRGGFPSGGAALPSFSLIPVQKRFVRRPTATNA